MRTDMCKDSKLKSKEEKGGKPTQNHAYGLGSRPTISWKRKCLMKKMPADDYERIVLSVTQPSYMLKLGNDNIREKNRSRMCFILQRLMQHHDWVGAMGVLSILLKGTQKDACASRIRFKYSVAMELLNHIQNEKTNNTISIRDILNIWSRRIDIKFLTRRQNENTMLSIKRDKFVVFIEFIIFQLMNGNGEHDCLSDISLLQEDRFDGEPVFSMIIGMIFYQLWYSKIPEDVKPRDTEKISEPAMVDAASQSHLSALKFDGRPVGSLGHDVSFSDESEDSVHCYSNSLKHKEIKMEVDADFRGEAPMHLDINKQGVGFPAGTKKNGLFYIHSDENDVTDAGVDPVMSACYLSSHKYTDSWVLPMRIQMWNLNKHLQDNDYIIAVKHLNKAVYSNFPMLPALLPLVQLLLIGGKYEEVTSVVEKFCENSSAALPFRLKAHLKENFGFYNKTSLSKCFEDTLNCDPACEESLEKLINLHVNGDYSSESLLEMIALHVDAAFPEDNVWKEFAACFLKVFYCEEDRLSVCHNQSEDGGGKKLGDSLCCPAIKKPFIYGKTGKLWKLRCRWWITRHFCTRILASEVTSGDWQRVTYKAACASHMYGPESEYALKALSALAQAKRKDLLKLLRLHLRNSVRLHESFKNTIL